jgi:hypothetical protein
MLKVIVYSEEILLPRLFCQFYAEQINASVKGVEERERVKTAIENLRAIS